MGIFEIFIFDGMTHEVALRFSLPHDKYMYAQLHSATYVQLHTYGACSRNPKLTQYSMYIFM